MKLVTWNTQSCRGLDGQVSPARVVREAQALADFDVLCLQEIAVNYPALSDTSAADQPAALAALLPGFRVFFGAAVEEFAADGTARRFGNLVATRLPVAQVQHHPLPYPADSGVSSIPRMCTVVTVTAPGLGPLRVMTTHLEFYSRPQRLAQARALPALHMEYRAQAEAPPLPIEDGSPFGPKMHAAEALLCGDFNLQPDTPEYAALTEPFAGGAWHDVWRLLHRARPHDPTFCVHEQLYLPQPVAFDFVFASDGLAGRVRRIEVDGRTRASDHQPVLVELD
jgi:endonuclease/exonuclease/phosphatase family metal-dependent hydrolase